MEHIRKTTTSSFTLLLIVQIILILLGVVGLIYASFSNNLYFDHINAIAIGSLVFFVILCVLGWASTKLYITFLVFQIIAFPSIVDNFIPGVYYGNTNELGTSIFPFFTHIDVYLFLGIVKGVLKKNRIIFCSNNLLIISVIVLFLSSIINLFYSKDSLDFLLVIVGFFHLRYLIWAFLLFSFFDFSSYQKPLINGLILSVMFLFAEAMINTHINGFERLTSGTLGNNSFGNIIACITVYFIFMLKTSISKQYNFFLYLCIAIGIITVLLTGTRMALLAGIILFFIVYFYYNKKSFLRMFYFMFIMAGIVFMLVLTGVYKKVVPKRFDIGYLTEKIHFNIPQNGKNIIEIESFGETRSFLTRLKLYNASLNMISKNPVFGIGSMRWNYYKNEYGFEEKILLDSHNGYLAIVSQFGLFSLFFIYFIYFYPFKLLKSKILKKNIHPYMFMAIISLGMAVSDFSNAGIYKHQIFALLCLNIVFLVYSENYVKKNENE